MFQAKVATRLGGDSEGVEHATEATPLRPVAVGHADTCAGRGGQYPLVGEVLFRPIRRGG